MEVLRNTYGRCAHWVLVAEETKDNHDNRAYISHNNFHN